MFESIFDFLKPFTDPYVCKRIVTYNKNESESKLKELMG
jgi:hypothetical protein